ncbi:MAG TPA: hypothetical protein VG963_10510, partial [Polyangiaceae bacterium]|nr:hypothetical protein [Polyangiaceae bacterium]
MDSVDLSRVERRARARYEWARARAALLGFAPVLLVVAAAALIGKHASVTAALGVALFGAGVVMLWYGRELKRAVLPGVLAGLIPLALVLCANQMHGCVGDNCMMVCVPACVVGGVVAGIVVGSVAARRRAPLAFWISASGLTLLTGAMGCACVGYAGVVGLAAGYVAGVLP